jgi:DNA (cytosine-5)-methyltransferase 1
MHGSLFAGVGGFDLAAQWVGWTNVFQCENNPFCQRVLKYHFPNTILHEDIKKTDFSKYRGTIDVVSGGFPCQPYSYAGKRKGTEDNRYLWPEMLRAIREIQPTWVVAENVLGILTIERGMVFESVCADLENQGYKTQSFIIPACAVGAPHLRYRVWIIACRADTGIENLYTENISRQRIIANPDSIGSNQSADNRERQNEIRSSTKPQRKFARLGGERNTSDTDENRQQNDECKRIFEIETFCSSEVPADPASSRRIQIVENRPSGQSEQNIPDWEEFPTQPPICRRDDGISGKLVNITFPAWRGKSIEAFGNAIVPQVAHEFFKGINKLQNYGKQEQVSENG